MVVEIADTTLRFDLTAKATLYARADIAEYWVLDIGAGGLPFIECLTRANINRLLGSERVRAWRR